MPFIFTELNSLSRHGRLELYSSSPQPLSEILLYFLSPICPAGNYHELPDIVGTLVDSGIRHKMQALTMGGAAVRQDGKHYTSDGSETQIIDTKDVLPPTHRLGGLYDDTKLHHVLEGINKQVHLPPIAVRALGGHETHTYEIVDGIHRYYSSVRLGLSKLPVVIS
ncbi:MAG: ParB/RepB/Spo0J family partition protein [Hyalangium sp.]|uniref:ParB/RepB/Spo0J family partition protein n=1 Tax=Hyalangium sp. TaxID=2028555 RepID=UPI003899BA25